MQPIDAGRDLPCHVRNRIHVRHVALDGEPVAPVRPYLLHLGGGRGAVTVDDDDLLQSLVHQSMHGRAAEAVGSAGDQGQLPLESSAS